MRRQANLFSMGWPLILCEFCVRAELLEPSTLDAALDDAADRSSSSTSPVLATLWWMQSSPAGMPSLDRPFIGELLQQVQDRYLHSH